MKKILIVIHDMRIGGAQRSLLSFLNCLCEEDMQSQYAIDLMVIDPVGSFYSQIPEEIHILPPPEELRWLGSSVNAKLFFEHFTWNSVFGELSWLKNKKKHQELNLQQRLWNCWHSRIPQMETEYDVAISYMDGVPNYYVVDKVSAPKKVLWIHSEYQKQGYHREFDRPFFEAADSVVTICQNCKECILREFPQLKDRTVVLENITDNKEILKKSQTGICPEFQDDSHLKLLTVARLNQQKGVDMAVKAAHLLKQAGIPFQWLVAGDGPEHSCLQADIEKLGLQENFVLLGSVDNPYAYMAACDVIVQPSRVEGKSIVLDEAKILCKPIVATNYATVADSLEHGCNGWIVEMTPAGIFKGIERLYKEEALRQTMIQNLEEAPKGNTQQLQKYIDIMF